MSMQYKHKNAKSLVQKFILMYPDKVITYSLSQIANELHYSEASIIKSFKLLGYKGLKDLKKKVFLKLKLEDQDDKQVKGLLIESIMATDRSLAKNTNVNRVISIIKDRKIVLQGFGEFYQVALDFQKVFLKIGFNAFACEFKEQLDLFENEVLFLLTSRGSSAITDEAINYARKKKMKIIAITSSDHQLDTTKLDLVITFIHFSLKPGYEVDKNILIRYVLRLLVEMIEAAKTN